ncbi:MAG: hypothetical protein K2N90_10355 [Lachnospiraceae bacterium]|nr:hypothetical protein [Lachnospiraceae bacterium]
MKSLDFTGKTELVDTIMRARGISSKNATKCHQKRRINPNKKRFNEGVSRHSEHHKKAIGDFGVPKKWQDSQDLKKRQEIYAEYQGIGRVAYKKC